MQHNNPTLYNKPSSCVPFLVMSRFPSPLPLFRTVAHQWWREQQEGGGKGDGWIMSDHKRVGLHRAFSPSGLSAAPGSNIHLAWCIPGLETLMWFVGESRWQVHGSTLLTDSAGASGRVHNNTECLSPPSFPLPSNHSPNPTINTHADTRRHTFSSCDITVLVPGGCRGTGWGCWLSARHYQSYNLLFSTLFSSQCFCLFSYQPLSLYLVLCTHLFRLTSLHSLLLSPHSCACPLTRPSSSFGSHSLHQSLSSFLFLHLFCSPQHFPTEHALKFWKFNVLFSHVSVEMMSCNKNKSIHIC